MSYGQMRRVKSSQVSCPGGTLYRIQSGDTLWGLSRRFGVDTNDILGANPGLNPQNLQVGQEICIPGTAPAPGPEPGCPGGTSYIIKRGDTFYDLARQYGVGLEELIAANPGINPDRLQVGQQICIPTAPSIPEVPELPCTGLLTGAGPEVAPGQTVGSILLRQLSNGDAEMTVTISGLSEPSELDPRFNGYFVYVMLIPESRPPIRALIITLDQAANSPGTWVGTATSAGLQEALKGNAFVQVRATIDGLPAEEILSGNLNACGG